MARSGAVLQGVGRPGGEGGAGVAGAVEAMVVALEAGSHNGGSSSNAAARIGGQPDPGGLKLGTLDPEGADPGGVDPGEVDPAAASRVTDSPTAVRAADSHSPST